MKRPYFNKFSTLLISLTTLAHIPSQACGPELYSEMMRFSILMPEIIENDALSPFHYSLDKLHSYNDDPLFMDREKNIAEWVAYGAGNYQGADVLHIQYNTSADSFLTIAQQKNWNHFEDNDWISWMDKTKNKAAQRYMIYAKEVEKNMAGYGWSDWSAEKNDKNKHWPILIKKGIEELNNVKKDNFLQERYAFQIIKSAYYNSIYNKKGTQYHNEAIKLYDKYLKNSTSIVSSWALIYIAELETNPQKRAQILLAAFDKSDEKKLRAFQLMNFSEIEKLHTSTQDKYLQELSTVILNLKNSGRGLEQIKKVYQLNPKSPYLKLMINREVNKLEEWIWSRDNNLFWPTVIENKYFGSANHNDPHFNWDTYLANYYNKLKDFEKWAFQNRVEDIKYHFEVRNYLKNIQKENNIKNSYMSVVLAHMYNMTKEHKEAENILKSLNPAQTDPIVIQYHYDKNISMLEQYDFKLQKTRDLFSMSLIDIDMRSVPKYKYRYYNDYSAPDTSSSNIFIKKTRVDPDFLVYTGIKLIEKGLRAEGAMYIASSEAFRNEYAYQGQDDPYSYGHISVLEKYLLPEDVDQILAMKNKKEKRSINMFEHYMLPLHMADENMYLDLKGTLYLRQKDYANALKTFEQIDDNFWSTKYEFNQYLPIESISTLPQYMIPKVQTGNGQTYQQVSKKEIIKDIITFQDTITTTKNEKRKADYQLYLANAMYNISHYGSAWMTFAYGKSSMQGMKQPYNGINYNYYSVPENSVTQLDNYYELRDAIKLYADVLNNSSASLEQKTIATAMLIRANQHVDEYNNGYTYNYTDKKITARDITSNNELYKLLLKYSQTKAYQSLKTHCPDF